MTTSSAPAAPNPTATAQAQTDDNITTAIANADMNHVNQTNAYGDNTSYTQNGTQDLTENGVNYQIPTYSESTTLSAPQQQLYNTAQSTEQGAANTAQGLVTQAQGELSMPLNLDASNINNFTNTQWEQPFATQWGQNQDKLTQQLADQGINVNDPAYNTAMNNFDQQQQQAQDTYDTSMFGQAQNAATTVYNQPVNELTALLGDSQISSPSQSAATQTNVPTTDYASIANQGYANTLAQYNAQTAQNSAMYGGLFGLGSAALTAF